MSSRPGRDKPKTKKLVFTAPSDKHSVLKSTVRTKTGWLGMRIMGPSGAT